MRRILPWITLFTICVGCGSDSMSPTPTTSSAPYSQTDLVVGTGAQVNAGNRAVVNYSGWLYDSSKTDGKGTLFDSGSGFTFVVGAGQTPVHHDVDTHFGQRLESLAVGLRSPIESRTDFAKILHTVEG